MVDARQVRQVHCLLYGEELAQALAKALSEKMPHPMLRRAYTRQAADEAKHAALFREYLRGAGAEAPDAPEVPEFDGYRRFLVDAAERGHLVTVVMGMNVALEGLSCVGFDLSARWVEATGGDPAWVRTIRAVEQDERRHILLARPALRALGGGAIPGEAREAMGEVREVAAATLSNMAQYFARWGIGDPVALFDAAIREVHADLFASAIDPIAA